MINWTNGPRVPGQKDLPIPNDKWECSDLVHEVEELLQLFEEGTLDEEMETLQSEGIELLEEVRPHYVSESNYGETWENSLKMWLFRYEITLAARSHRSERHLEQYKEVCEQYLEALLKKQERYQELEDKKNA